MQYFYHFPFFMNISSHSLDRTDRAILQVLQNDCSLSAAKVAEMVGTTTPTAWRRIARLESLKIISRRVALVDRRAVGLTVLVFAHVKLLSQGREALARFEKAIRNHPEILDCYTMMGETDFLLRIATRDIAAYEAFFLDHLSKFPGVQTVNSSIALSVVKETTAVPLAQTNRT